MAPYDPIRHIGGILVLLYHFDDTEDNFIPTRPTAIGSDHLQYPYTLPTLTEVPQLRKFVIAIPKITTMYCQATDPLSGRTITSNDLTVLLKAPAYQLGPFTIREAIDDAGASIGTATYLTIDKFGQLNMVFSTVAGTEKNPLKLSFFQGADQDGGLFPKWPFRLGSGPK